MTAPAVLVPHLITPEEARTLNLWPGDDGKPHVTYYDRERSLSFAWDGLLPYITVAWQGYAEPPRWLIYVEPVSARVDLIAFAAVCMDWVGKHWRHLPPHAFPPVRVPEPHEVSS